MNSTFRLVDLVSQAAAVQSLLRGKSIDEKLAWLTANGTLAPKPRAHPDERQTYWYETPLGSTCAFFWEEDTLVFVGNHTTFVVSDDA